MKKRFLLLLAALVMLCGCGKENGSLEQVMLLRSKLLGTACGFEVTVTADYGDKTYTFSAACEADEQGNLRFTVTRPETIAGITGRLEKEGGKLTFDDTALAFDLQAEGLCSPLSGPWVLIQALRGGFVRHCTMEGELLRVRVDDSFRDDALTLDVWLEGEIPVRADIYEKNRRILALEVKDFAFR